MVSLDLRLSSSLFMYFNIGKSITSQLNLVLTFLEIVEVLLSEIEEYYLLALQIFECRRLLTMVVSCSHSKVTSYGCSMVLLTIGRKSYETGKEDH